AVKMARKHHYENGAAQRVDILTFDGCFHGRSSAAIAASGSEKMIKGFGPVLPGFVHLAWDDLDAVKSAITDTTCAI
ncbi:aminotransferase class III-fold pyridoxal phosphate-dependent enzyme, partial [Escherichia coli]|nr:aminotransferase class III-fold pyridoxal phosphate-dependent enzyme [Escherichia coli]